MNTNINKTCLAFLLALSELETPLNKKQKQELADIGEQLRCHPQAWVSSTQPLLLKTIEAHSQLNQRYQFYQSQLDAAGEISRDLLPTEAEIRQLFPINIPLGTKGFESKEEPIGYDIQISNVMIGVNRSEEPEEAVKELTFLEKVKQFLVHSSQ
ncbi:MAG: hypothetical protein AB4426_09760 [Xenococcaceae cyanobacterium]